jgi:RNA polymerase sigma-70 factor (ECF subfamily)
MAESERPKPPGREPSDGSLLARIQQGSEDAAAALYARYAQRLRELARVQCSADLAGRVEPDDIVQSVFGSFFRGASQGYYTLPGGEELWKLFLVIALNKIRARGAYHRAARRDVRRTVAGAAFEHTLEQVAGDDQAANTVLRLTVEEILARLPEQHQQAVRLRAEGHEVAEIAEALGRSLRSTERLLQEARGRLAELFPLDESP